MSSTHEWLAADGASLDDAFAVFDQQDSGSVSFGVEGRSGRWFVKTAVTDQARESFSNAVLFHRAVSHRTILGPVLVDDVAGALVYPWVYGTVLNHATIKGSDRSGLSRFRQLPIEEVTAATADLLGGHAVVESEGVVAVDFYDGSMLCDFDAQPMRLTDLDDYRPGPFLVPGQRMSGSTSYMAPEEWEQGATIDHRTTVFTLGRAIDHLLRTDAGQWRGSDGARTLVKRATDPNPAGRYQSVRKLHAEWANVTHA